VFRLEKRLASPAKIARLLLAGVVFGALLHCVIVEVETRRESESFAEGRIAVPLAPGAVKDYYDPLAVDRERNLPDLRDGFAKPVTWPFPPPETGMP
jgi:hypothetical protein